MSDIETEFKKLEAVYTGICEYLAAEMGYREFSSLDMKRQAQIGNEAQDRIDNWDESQHVVIALNPPIPDTDLGILLRKHNEIAETILDIQDEENPYIP
jgi:hypothetical protein